MNGRPWTTAEITEAMRDDIPACAIAANIGRTPVAVARMRYRFWHRRASTPPTGAMNVQPVSLDEHDAQIERCTACGSWTYRPKHCGACGYGVNRRRAA